MMFWPCASTFAWKLVNGPNCEIIRGEVSIFRGGAGGLSYFSSGSFRGTLCVGVNSCPDAVASATGKIRKVKMLVFDGVTQLKVDKARLHLILIIIGLSFYRFLVSKPGN
jgi:hypothetical protein